MLRPMGNNILVKIRNPQFGSAIIDDVYYIDGVVVDIGSKVEIDIKKDDVLLLRPFCGLRVKSEDGKYLLIQERDILGVISE